MVKLSIRDLWGRATQKKEMKPEVRTMLLDLDGVYERREPVARQQDDDQRDDASGSDRLARVRPNADV